MVLLQVVLLLLLLPQQQILLCQEVWLHAVLLLLQHQKHAALLQLASRL
jgi:hypothetical protein